MKRNTFATITLFYLAAVLVLGGANAAGFAANIVLQLSGVALIGWMVWRPAATTAMLPLGLRRLFALVALFAVVQFLPLPPALWQHLPGRAVLSQGYKLLGVPAPWMPVSLDPWASLASFAWWLPAAALFMAMLRSDGPGFTRISRVIAAVAAISIAIGAMQRAGGYLYFYEITNFGFATGFFANVNHQATFLLAAIAFWGGARAVSFKEKPGARRSSPEANAMVYFSVLFLLIVGVLLSNSVAGIGLLIPVGTGIVLIERPNWKASRPVAFSGLALVACATVAFAVYGSLNNEIAGPHDGGEHTRLDFLHTGSRVLRSVAPVGSGLGTFVQIYHQFEKPATITSTYVNHAHNDLLELLIETGLFGLIGLWLFFAWWMPRSWQLWSAPRRDPSALAATLFTGATLAHSLVDYPLRTAAVSTIFAIGCALMLDRPRLAEPTTRLSRGSTGGELIAI